MDPAQSNGLRTPMRKYILIIVYQTDRRGAGTVRLVTQVGSVWQRYICSYPPSK